ncbi:hypothetical protein ACZ87_00435 [Candidatus Erwinia dacicola]|uniref:Uncharacterized protein n=1 Tax=Candidatus Erwinia dacicola TaxID=252393 RepID=A0A328TTE5_9GAMM|nr:hypothetical protein ACZ87_00435 [Candidatus Erwinia dacicola]
MSEREASLSCSVKLPPSVPPLACSLSLRACWRPVCAPLQFCCHGSRLALSGAQADGSPLTVY